MNSVDDNVAHLQWSQETDPLRWDTRLAALGGHPLQSCLWGEARREADGIGYLCLAARSGNDTVALARVETRRLPFGGQVAWIPRGPVPTAGGAIDGSLQRELRRRGYVLYAASPWQRSEPGAETPACPRTIWIDLTVGKERLLENLDAKCRYGARRALREGVVLGRDGSAADVADFQRLCVGISQTKGFALPTSEALMLALLRGSRADAPVQAHLFVARYEGQLAAGAFILQVGSSVHYLWGGTERAFSKLRAGEAVQVAVLEWAADRQAALYDLEGIDPVNNAGTYDFKKKLGGEEVVLAAPVQVPLDWCGTLVDLALRWRAGRAR